LRDPPQNRFSTVSTRSGHGASFFVALHATDPIPTCYSHSLILAFGVSPVRRREFITLVSGAAATWPPAAHAQQREQMRRMGVLMNLTADDAEGQGRLAAFMQGLQEAGWSVGRNVRVDLRWGGGDTELYRSHAAELIALAPDVFLAAGAI